MPGKPPANHNAISQIGNKNACVPPTELKKSHLHIRCRSADKAAWVKAAIRDKESGALLKAMSRGADSSALAAWVTTELNAAADKKLGPDAAARRKRGFTPGGELVR